MKLVCVMVLFLSALAGDARAQAPEAPRSLRLPSADTLLTQSQAVPERRDSLKNGTIIGAVIGGVAASAFALTICELLQEPSDPSCWPGTLAIGSVGAGVGAAAGAGIDALAARNPTALRPRAPASRRIVVTWQRRF